MGKSKELPARAEGQRRENRFDIVGKSRDIDDTRGLRAKGRGWDLHWKENQQQQRG